MPVVAVPAVLAHLPQYEHPVVVPGGHPLPVPAACNAPDAGGVPLVFHAQGVREGFKLPRPRQAGNQRLGVDVEAALEGARAEIEVQAALEPLLHEPRVGADLSSFWCKIRYKPNARGREVCRAGLAWV